MFAGASMGAYLAMPGANAPNASAIAGGFALWAGVYEAAATRRQGVADLTTLIVAAALGAASCSVWTAIVGTSDGPLWLLPVAAGAFLVDYAKRYGTLATSAAAMGFIGQAFGFGMDLRFHDFKTIGVATLIAIVAAGMLRILGGPSERDADALARCRDFRRVMAARLRRYHDALHHQDDAALARVIPRNAELTAAWAALNTLVREEFKDADLIAGYLNTEIRHLYALLQIVLAIEDSLAELQGTMLAIRERAAVGLVLHTLRLIVLQDAQDIDAALVAALEQRCDRLAQRANQAADRPIETRIALLRIGLATRHGLSPDPPPVQIIKAAASAPASGGGMPPTTRVACQAGLSALAIIALNSVIGMHHLLWALLASTFVISSSVADTWSRGVRRIAGTAVGVALGLGVALLFAQLAPVVWLLAAIAMIVYAMWLPLRYDVACGAYAFALVVTLAEAGNSSWGAASARGLDTVIGAAIGMLLSAVILPVRLRDQLADMLAAMLTAVQGRIAAAMAWIANPGGAAPPAVADYANLLAEVAAQKARFAGLRFEGILARDGDGDAVLLLRIDSLIATTMRLVGEARLATGHVDPALRDIAAGLDAQLRLAFDAALARVRRQGRPTVPPSDGVLPPLRRYMAASQPDEAATTGVLLAAALTHTSRKVIRTLADLTAELDQRNGFVTRPIAR
jgi:uncharacterized membrane protein YccC